MAIPHPIHIFLHNKRCGFKQLLNLAHIPNDILSHIFEWQEKLQLTLNYFDKWCRFFKNQYQKQIPNFIAEIKNNDYLEILNSNLSPSQKSHAMNQLIFKKQFPVLSSQHKRIKELCSTLPFKTSWDESLENHYLDCTIRLHDISEINDQEKTLSENKEIIRDI